MRHWSFETVEASRQTYVVKCDMRPLPGPGNIHILWNNKLEHFDRRRVASPPILHADRGLKLGNCHYVQRGQRRMEGFRTCVRTAHETG